MVLQRHATALTLFEVASSMDATSDVKLLTKQLSSLTRTLISLSSNVLSYYDEKPGCFDSCEKIDTASLRLLSIVKRVNKDSLKIKTNVEKLIDDLSDISVLLSSAERTVKSELSRNSYAATTLESCIEWLDSEIMYLADYNKGVMDNADNQSQDKHEDSGSIKACLRCSV